MTKQQPRKILAMLLCVVLFIGLFPASALAAVAPVTPPPANYGAEGSATFSNAYPGYNDTDFSTDITLTNTGTESVRGYRIDFANSDDNGAFFFSDPYSHNDTIAPSESITTTITVRPRSGLGVGTYTGTVRVYVNQMDPSNTFSIDVPVSFTVEEPTPITSVSVSPNALAVPMAGTPTERPNTFTGDALFGTGYTLDFNNCMWDYPAASTYYMEARLGDTGKVFRTSTQYYLRLRLNAAYGYTFTGLTSSDITLNGTAPVTFDNYGNYIIARFPYGAPTGAVAALYFADNPDFDVPAGYGTDPYSTYRYPSTAVTGGTKPYTFSKVSGPAWLTVRETNGELRGTRPNEDLSATTIIIQVQDSAATPATAQIEVAVGAVTAVTMIENLAITYADFAAPEADASLHRDDHFSIGEAAPFTHTYSAAEWATRSGDTFTRVEYLRNEGTFAPATTYYLSLSMAPNSGYRFSEEHPENFTFNTIPAVAARRLPGTTNTKLFFPFSPTGTAKAPLPDNATFTATGYDTGTLGGSATGREYSLDGGVTWNDFSSNASLSELSPGEIQIIQRGNGAELTDSDVYTITVTRSVVPETVTKTDCTTVSNNNGILSGVTNAMHYRDALSAGWTLGDGADITNLTGGNTYLVRVDAAGTALESDPVSFTIGSYSNKLATPSEVSFTATGTSTGTLSGLSAGLTYKVGLNAEVTTISDADVYLSGLSDGQAIYVWRKGDGVMSSDSERVTFNLTQPPRPTGLTYTSCTTLSNNDGTISNLNPETMEYRKENDAVWRPVPAETMENLTAGTYYIRVKPEGTRLASNGVNVPVTEFSSYTTMPNPNANFTATGYDTGTLTISNWAETMEVILPDGTEVAITGEITELTGLNPGTLTIINRGDGVTVKDTPYTITLTRGERPDNVDVYYPVESENGEVYTTTSHQRMTTQVDYDYETNEYVFGGEWVDTTGLFRIPEITMPINVAIRLEPYQTRLASEPRVIYMDSDSMPNVIESFNATAVFPDPVAGRLTGRKGGTFTDHEHFYFNLSLSAWCTKSGEEYVTYDPVDHWVNPEGELTFEENTVYYLCLVAKRDYGYRFEEANMENYVFNGMTPEKIVVTRGNADFYYRYPATGSLTLPVLEDSAIYDVPVGNQYEAYTVNVAPAVTGGVEPFSYSLSPAIDGLSVSAAGLLTYDRMAASTEQIVTLTVTDANEDSDTMEITIGAVTPILPVTFSAIPLPAPVPEAIPATTIAETEQYTGTVVWTHNPSVFGYGSIYQATITLTPKEGYTLRDVEANFFTVEGAESVTNSAGSGTIIANFPATPKCIISGERVLDLTAPEAGAEAMTAFVTTEELFTDFAIAWSPSLVSGTFADGVAYTATLQLFARNGYEFDTETFTASVSGAAEDGISIPTLTEAFATIVVTFPATAVRPITPTPATAAVEYAPALVDTVVIPLTNAESFDEGTTVWSIRALGAEQAYNVTLNIAEGTLTLVSPSGTLATGNYAIQATNAGSRTSGELAVHVPAFVPNPAATLTPPVIPSVVQGYGEQPQAIFTFTNTGNIPLTNVVVNVAGNTLDYFTWANIDIASSMAPGAVGTCYVKPKTGFLPGVNTAQVTITADELEETVTASATFTIAYDHEHILEWVDNDPAGHVQRCTIAKCAYTQNEGAHEFTDGVCSICDASYKASFAAVTFDAVAPGYSAQSERTVVIQNTGTLPLLNVTLSVSGADYTLNGASASIPTLVSGDSTDNWTIAPKTGLSEGVHSATLTLTADNLPTMTKSVTFEVDDDLSDVITIAALTLDGFAPDPEKTGAVSILETAEYTGTVSWSPVLSGGLFAYDTAYTATITVSPKLGYKLAGVPANFFTLTGAETVTNDADSGVVTAVFPRTLMRSRLPAATITTVDMETSHKVVFQLTNGTPFGAGCTWKAYETIEGATEITGLTITNDGNTVTVTKSVGELSPGSYYLAATEPGKLESQRLKMTVRTLVRHPAASLGDVSFGTLDTGYASVAAEALTITNTGNVDLTNVTLALTGEGAENFVLTPGAAALIAPGEGNTSYMIRPKDACAPGVYTATVTLSAAEELEAAVTATVSFAVADAHSHEWVYDHDANGHWEKCTQAHCIETRNAGAHNELGENGACTVCGYCPGVTVSGTVRSFGTAAMGDVTVRLMQGATEVATAVADSNGDYSFAAVAAGEYTLAFEKTNHVTRESDISVGNAEVDEDATICLNGDVSGDGKILSNDSTLMLHHIRGTTPLGEYQIECGDLTGDGKVLANDKAILMHHIRGTTLLW